MKAFLTMTMGMMLVIQCIRAQTAVPPSAGDGTEANPYQITSLENLYWIAADSVNWKYHYIQTAEINAAQTSVWFGGQGWVPIYAVSESGGFTNWFTGSYDGQGHIIDSLFINRPNERIVGLFGYSAGMISNLGVINVNITGGSQVGGIIGWGSVKNCFSTGYIQSTMSNTGLDGAGGLVGTGSVENCYSNATVNSFTFGGGLVGNSGLILNSYANGTVSGRIAGGLAGISSYLIMNSYSRGSVNGSYKSGGLAGASASSSSLILNCYAAGKVTGAELVGGLTGDSSYVYNSYWNIDSVDHATNTTGKAKTTMELKNPLLYVNAPWDSSIWSMDDMINDGYPYLSWQNPNGDHLPAQHIVAPASGDGSSYHPFQIATLENLYWLTSNPTIWSKCFIQTANINASETRNLGDGEGWVPIGIGNSSLAFHGNYNGNGHTIDSLYVNRPEDINQGLFGYADVACVIDSLGVTNAEITGSSSVGGISGASGPLGYIGNCFSTGEIKAQEGGVGGLVGATSYGRISNCYSKAKVEGKSYTGGLIGVTISSTISYCYAAGTVTGDSSVGGLVGVPTFFPRSQISFSFWDTVTSGQSQSEGGVGKSTNEMKTTAVYSDVGWDPAFWFMDSAINDGYPYLSWQHPGGTPIPRIAKIVLSEKSLDCGRVALDTSNARFINVRNTGYDTLRITNIVSTNQRFTVSLATVKLAPSATTTLWVTFTPQDTTTQSGFMVLTHNALGSPDSVSVSGQGALLTSVNNNEPQIPIAFSMRQNYPNPFNPATQIEYDIPHTTPVLVRVYDLLGREVSQLVNEVQHPGRYRVTFDGSRLSSGIYFYSMTAGTFHQVGKMVLTK
jgi:hypothetical protein